MPSTCQSDADCNGEGKCVQAPNGSFFCDCTIGYIEPHCQNRDPCLLEGSVACQNGSTCKRIGNFEYECKCRVPYSGEFCETYNLCDIDVDECVEDLITDDPGDPFCNPCVAGATCTRLSKRHYTCDCPSGNEKCYISPLHIRDVNEYGQRADDGWNPIIPTIALTSCILYFIILIIVLILCGRRRKYRPKLIVACDIHQFDDLSYYLVSVETGRQWTAGTKGNVYCFLCGENGDAGPFPLYDPNLSEVHALQRCQEDNFLFSHEQDLGRIEKVVLWYDKWPRFSSWFCDQITVKNLKTEENWFFYTASWFSSKEFKRKHDFSAATAASVQRHNRAGINCQHYCYQVARHHSYISPFIFISPSRITLMFAEWMSYMLILIALYGFITSPDPDIWHTSTYIFTTIVPINGSVAAISCFWIALTCALLLLAFTRIKRTPTLLVWHNKPGMSECDIHALKKSAKMPAPNAKTFKDAWTSTDFGELTYSAPPAAASLPPARTAKSDISQHLFRIPSTDIVRTEKWVHESVEDSHGPENLHDADLVHDYTPKDQLNIPETVLDHGLIGGLTDGRQQEPNTFVYAISSKASHNAVRRHIETDIREIYAGMRMQRGESRSPVNASALKLTSSNSIKPSPPISKIFFKESRPMEDDIPPGNSINMAGGDFTRDENEQIDDKRVKVYVELCEIDYDPCWNIIAKISIALGWIICLALVVAATVICVIYGGRYGYQRTYDWIISLVICWLESFLVYQFIKILLIVIIVTVLVKNQKMLTIEEEKIRDRLQVYYVNGLTVLPHQYPLKYVQYLPKYWIPPPDITSDSTTNNSSATSIKN